MISNVNLYNLINHHYTNKSNLTTVLSKSNEDKKKKSGAFSSGSSEEYMVYALEENTNRLVSATCSYDMFENGILMKTANMVRHPRVYFEMQVSEANILVCDFEVVNILKKFGKKFYSITEDLVPFLADNQYNNKLLDAWKGVDRDETEEVEEEEAVEKYFEDAVEGQEAKESFKVFAYVSDEFFM